MTIIKTFFQNKRNIVISLIIALSIVAISLTIIFYNKNKPVKTVQVVSEQTSSEEISSTIINVAPIVVDKSVSSSPSSTVSSDTSSKEVTLKVDGNPSSKVTSSKPQVKVDGNTSSKPVSSKPTESKPKPPVSSEPVTPPPTHESEHVEPPVNPDGPQHGDTKLSSTGETLYYHIGLDRWILDWMWQKWGNYPQAKKKMVTDTMWEVDTSFLKEGEKQWFATTNEYIIWCEVQNSWIVEKSYNYNTHKGNDHGQR